LNSLVFMFSGQGSQYYHMGKELFENHHIFRKWMLKLDDIAYRICGQSILSHMYDEERKRSDPFKRTFYTHPAIFMVEYALARVLLESGIEPDYLLGTSMGEFASAAIAEVMTCEESLHALIKQADALETYCQEGGMLAILHDPLLYYEMPLIYENSELVSINFHSHFIISGQVSCLRAIESYLRENQINWQRLPVTQAFHSPLIDPAADVYIDFLNQRSFSPPQITFISCTYASIPKRINNVYFWEVIRKPIAFRETFKKLEDTQNYIYIDLGPSGTLANFVKYNLSDRSRSQSMTILSHFSLLHTIFS